MPVESTEERDTALLQYFWDLASVDVVVRTKCAGDLIRYLYEKQEEFDLKTAQTSDGAGRVSPQLRYSVTRLIKGLCSGREGARQGFSLALLEVLNIFRFLKLSDVLDEIDTASHVKGSMNGQEERDQLFGRVFGALAVVGCGRLATDADVAGLSGRLVVCLRDIGGRKEYLRLASFETIIKLLDQIDEEVFTAHVLPPLLPLLQLPPDEFTPELVALALTIHKRFSLSIEQVPGSQWKRRLLHRRNLPRLAAIVRESTYNHPRVHAVWTHLLDQLAPAARPAEDDGEGPAAQQVPLADFWYTVVDEGLLGGTAERKFLAFELFNTLLERLPPERLSLLFTRNLVRCLINQLRRPDNVLHAAAVRALEQLHRVAEQHPAARLAIALQLLGEHGSRQFDLLTQTNTVERLLTGLDTDQIATYAAHLHRSLLNASAVGDEARAHDQDEAAGETSPAVPDDPVEARRAIEAYRIWAIEQIYAVLKHNLIGKLHAHGDVDNVLQHNMEFLLFHGVFTDQSEAAATPALNERERETCNRRFFSLLAELNAPTGHNHKPADAAEAASSDTEAAAADEPEAEDVPRVPPGLRRDGSVWAVGFVDFAHRAASREGVSELKPMSDAAADAVKQVRKQVRLMHKSSPPSPSERAFELLLSNVAMQLYSLDADQVDDTVSIIQELVECRKRLQEQKAAPTPSKKRKSQPQPAADDAASSSPMEVLMDVFISLLSRPSALLRGIVDQAFKVFAADMTPGALQLLVDVITGKADEDEDDEGSDDDDDDDESEVEVDATGDSDQDTNDSNGKKAKASNKTPGRGGSSKKRKFEPQEEEDDEASGSSSSEEELITDDAQMEQFDAKLAEMFKHMKNSKRDKKEVARRSAHFKFRAVELLEIVIKKLPTSELLIGLVAPLVQTVRRQEAVRGAEGINLVGRIGNVLRKLYHCKGPAGPFSEATSKSLLGTIDALWDSLRAYRHKRSRGGAASKQQQTAAAAAAAAAGGPKQARLPELASDGLHFITRIIVAAARPSSVDANSPAAQNGARWLDAGMLGKLSDSFKRALNRLFTRRNASFSCSFFTHFLDREPWLGWLCAPEIVAGSSSGRSGFLKAQSLAMLALLARKRTLLDESDRERVAAVAAAVVDALETLLSHQPALPTQQLRDALGHVHTYCATLVAVRQDTAAEQALATRLERVIKAKLEPSNAYQASLPIQMQCAQLLHTLRRQQSELPDRKQLKLQRKQDRKNNSKRRAKRLKLEQQHNGAADKQPKKTEATPAADKVKHKSKKPKPSDARATAAAAAAVASGGTTPAKSAVVVGSVKGTPPSRSGAKPAVATPSKLSPARPKNGAVASATPKDTSTRRKEKAKFFRKAS
eukprot:TRINITY_DN77_c0_g1_i1.p1 TRINITY_DN77_c0_g1~~TRINITY_DN77_c0_g1_i1.p1  ORF type:complete len:1362 (+),score=632.42 TRINITY_DN77_c0_g1_i1:121-4206(+)